jgi:Ring finger domain
MEEFKGSCHSDHSSRNNNYDCENAVVSYIPVTVANKRTEDLSLIASNDMCTNNGNDNDEGENANSNEESFKNNVLDGNCSDDTNSYGSIVYNYCSSNDIAGDVNTDRAMISCEETPSTSKCISVDNDYLSCEGIDSIDKTVYTLEFGTPEAHCDSDEDDDESRHIKFADPLFSSAQSSSAISNYVSSDDSSVSISSSMIHNNILTEVSGTMTSTETNQNSIVDISQVAQAQSSLSSINNNFIHRLVQSTIRANSDRTFRRPTNRQCAQTIIRSTIRLIKFIVLCPIVFVLNVFLILILIIYISCLCLAACFCPSCLERVLNSEHRYSIKQIQTNLIRRECLEITKDIENHLQLPRSIKTNDKVSNDKYEILTTTKRLIFSKPLTSKQTTAVRPKPNRGKESTSVSDAVTATDQECLSTGNEEKWTMDNWYIKSYVGVEEGNSPPINEGEKLDETEPDVNKANEQNDDDMYENGEGCDICMGCYKVGDVITWSRNPACGHMFHEACITEWLCGTQRKLTCPCCRSEYVFEVDQRKKQTRNIWGRIFPSVVINDDATASTNNNNTTAIPLPSLITDNDSRLSEPTHRHSESIISVNSEAEVLDTRSGNEQDTTTSTLITTSSIPNISGIMLSASGSNASDDDDLYYDNGAHASTDEEVVFAISESSTFSEV